MRNVEDDIWGGFRPKLKNKLKHYIRVDTIVNNYWWQYITSNFTFNINYNIRQCIWLDISSIIKIKDNTKETIINNIING